MNALWLFLGAVVVCLAVMAWLERRDARVLRDHLRRRYPVRLTNSFWGALNPNDGHDAEAGAADPRENPEAR
ncbi:hypothetical protein [Rhizobacter sp. Root404]|jgi:hypothetical protein|uniref:hypothetical protein n=1 Tax=Rhizobacter sp. Root404 TaxID=1736528 RepID=UPI0006FE230A|nr:hypothetical protein [Rhizobacter sp. Root404]KQW37976.1 hypothetical protein ASC76_07860 [Rhizobacter sp. Root404]